MPLTLKYGIDCVIHTAPFAKTLLFFCAYGAASLSSTYFDGRKSIENSKVV